MSEATMSMEDLLNSSVDELADLKEFKPLPVGTYLCTFDWEKAENPAGVRLIFRVKEVIELADPSEENVEQAGAPDAKETIPCFFFTKEGGNNSMGQGQLKNIVSEVFVPTFGGETTAAALDAAKGCEVRITLTHRSQTKDGETKFYPNLKHIELA